MLSFLIFAAAAAMPVPPGEQPVDPYTPSNANAGAQPFTETGMWHAFHEQAGVDRLVDDFVDHLIVEPTIKGIFEGQDIVRLRRLLKEQFCYLLNGGCSYSGRDMKAGHAELGIQAKDMNVTVMVLQQAMAREHIAFSAQNRLLAKLAPMRRDIVTR